MVAPGRVFWESEQRLPSTSREVELHRQHSQDSLETELRQLETCFGANGEYETRSASGEGSCLVAS